MALSSIVSVKLYLLVAIDRISTFAFVELREKAIVASRAISYEHSSQGFPYKFIPC